MHADINAAFNIAATTCASDKAEIHRLRASRKMMRKFARAELAVPGGTIFEAPDLSCHREILSGWEDSRMISREA